MKLKYIGPGILVILFQMFSCFALEAQPKNNGSLTGKVIDKSTNQPLEYATVSIISKQSGKTVTGGVTNVKGEFSISNLPFDTYQVTIGFIGYEQISLDNITLDAARSTSDIGTISLVPSTRSLESVTVTGDKPLVENKIDKIVFNVTNDITSQGGAAIDVLKKVPQVTVDVNGNVELQGNSNIKFLINGKPSSVFGNSLTDALASIPASQIKSIEAITNPGAKYDSQGTGGIINIILHENKMQGLNGNITLSAGSRLENGSLNLNARKNNIGFNAFFSGNANLRSKVPNSQDRFSTDSLAGTITHLVQRSTTDFIRNGFRSGLGFDWNLSKTDLITGSIGLNQFGNKTNGLTDQQQIVTDFSSNQLEEIITVRNSANQMRIRSLDWSVDYKKKFSKEGQELDFLYNSSYGMPRLKYIQSQSADGGARPFSGSASNNPGKDMESEFSVNYVHPINENFHIESGAKYTHQNILSNANVQVYDPFLDLYINDAQQSYHLDYTMNIYAAYLSTTFKLFNYFNFKLGSRYEFTDVSVDFPNTVIPHYGTLVPSLVISHDFSKGKTIKFAYGKRIERPEYRELNPFINLADPYNITTGNPLLKPEFGNNFELGYSSSFKKGGNINISLVERINTQDVKQITTFHPTFQIGDTIFNNVSVTSNTNIGREYNSGITASGSIPFTKKLNLRGNLLVTHRYIVTDIGNGNQSYGLRVRFNLNLSWELPRNLVIEGFGFYNAPFRNIQGKNPQFFIYNFALRKLSKDKKASIGITTTNPFSKYVRQVTTITAGDYVSTSVRQIQLRSFGISFSYKFGKMEYNKNNRNREQDENSDLSN